jgi:hypothetical protein
MTFFRFITLALWATCSVMLTLLLLRAHQRRLWRVCPAFFFYAGFQILKIVGLFASIHNVKWYFVAFWTGEIIDLFLVVAVLYGFYCELFRGYEGLRVLQDALFRWSAAVCVLIAVVTAATVHGADSDRLVAGLLAFALGAAILKAGLMMFAMIMSSALALRWGHYAFGALVGFALYNTVELASVAARLQTGLPVSGAYGLIRPAAYTCALLVWVGYFFSKEREQLPLASVPENNLASWNQALLEILTK